MKKISELIINNWLLELLYEFYDFFEIESIVLKIILDKIKGGQISSIWEALSGLCSGNQKTM